MLEQSEEERLVASLEAQRRAAKFGNKQFYDRFWLRFRVSFLVLLRPPPQVLGHFGFRRDLQKKRCLGGEAQGQLIVCAFTNEYILKSVLLFFSVKVAL